MRVLVIADHSPRLGATFAADTMSLAWRAANESVDVVSFPFAGEASAVPQVWRHHAAANGGFAGTALVVPTPEHPQWHQTVAEQIHAAIRARMTRIVIVLPRYAFPDAGSAMISALATLCGAEESSALPDDVAQFHNTVAYVAEALTDIDVVVAYSHNIPLTGMHGMSGTAALLKDLDAEIAQQRERSVSGLLHALGTNFGGVPPHEAHTNLLAGSRTQQTYKDLARNDAAGNCGGLGFALLCAGARAMPLNQALFTQFGLAQQIDAADVIVVKQDVLDGPDFSHSTLGVVAPRALGALAPVVAVVEEQIMGTRELAAQGIASAYVVGNDELSPTITRIAKSWSPLR